MIYFVLVDYFCLSVYFGVAKVTAKYKEGKQEKIMSIDYVICNFVICNFCNNKVFVELQNMNKWNFILYIIYINIYNI